MFRLVLLLMIVVGLGCNDIPPCHPEGQGGPIIAGPTPLPPDDSGPYGERYKKNDEGEVCKCSPYEGGCTTDPNGETSEAGGHTGAESSSSGGAPTPAPAWECPWVRGDDYGLWQWGGLGNVSDAASAETECERENGTDSDCYNCGGIGASYTFYCYWMEYTFLTPHNKNGIRYASDELAAEKQVAAECKRRHVYCENINCRPH